METKRCPRCERDLAIAEFYVNKARHDGLSGFCVACQREAATISRIAQRTEFLVAMGGRCERCGFTDPRALQVDHINGDGGVERASGRSGTATFYAKVLAARDQYMLLCANCNQIKKVEQNETVGSRVYTRQTPTKKLRSVGKGNWMRSD